MECRKCGRDLMEGAAFCPYCGEKAAAADSGEPIYSADVKGLLKSGKLMVYQDRVEMITSSVQRYTFQYAGLVSVRKGLDRIFFVMEDGRTESCPVSMKVVHEAFLYIEKAVKPYLEERKSRLLSDGVRYSFPSSMGLTGGILNILEDRAEFRSKTGQVEGVPFQEVKSAALTAMGQLEFSLFDGRTKSFAADKELRGEVLAFVEQAIQPYLEERKAALLARGIYYSCLSSRDVDSGSLDVLENRVEYTSRSGQRDAVSFREARAVRLLNGTLELALTDGRTKSFSVEKDVGGEILAFVERGIEPYVQERTVGFDAVFGVDERVEFNEARGVFHIIRQGGGVITESCPVQDLVRCEQVERSASEGMLSGVLSGGMAILNSAAGTRGEEMLRAVGVVLTIRAGGEERTEEVRFGDFLLGLGRSNKKYERCAGESARLLDYLEEKYPACERIALPEPEEVPAPVEAEEVPPEPAAEMEEKPAVPEKPSAAERDRFGIIKYIEGVSDFISECTAPMTIAIRGSWGSGRDGIMQMLADHLEESCGCSPVWFHTWQFSRFDLGEQLPMIVGNRLIGQLSGVSSPAAKDRAVKVAKGLIGITTGIISQGSSDGQDLMDAIFQGNSADSLEKLVRNFAALVKKRGEGGKVIFFIDDLDRLTPGKSVELLEAMQAFFDCEGCVFVVTADYSTILRGGRERYGEDFDEGKGKRLFDKLFQVSFRVPASGLNLHSYVKDKLEHIGIDAGERELESYVELIRHSVGSDPKSMDRLFNSFLLLKKLASPEMYQDGSKRLMLFALLCMQARFHDAYDHMVEIRDKVTPEFLAQLCSEEPEALDSCPVGGEKAEFCAFAKAFYSVINSDGEGCISDLEYGAFAEVLEFSSITSQ